MPKAAEPPEQGWVKVAAPSAVTVAAPVMGSIAVTCTGRPCRTYTVVVVPLALQTLNCGGPVAWSTSWNDEKRWSTYWTLLSPP